MTLTTKNIADITGGVLSGDPSLPVEDLLFDTRKVLPGINKYLFIAIRASRDGHTYIPDAYKAGVRTFLVNRGTLKDPLKVFEGSCFIEVENTMDALHALALHKRNNFMGKVISVTGSNGKTIVKEWLYHILSAVKKVTRSPRSYNSQTGVPLSLWMINDSSDYAIIEAGMSEMGEIKKLERIIKPEIGIFTNIGEAHQAGFPDVKTKAVEKAGLFKNASVLIYPMDHQLLHEVVSDNINISGKEVLKWSEANDEAEVRVTRKRIGRNRTGISFKYQNCAFDAEIPFSDTASFENAVTVTSVLLYLGIEPEIIRIGLSRLEPVAMRMELKEGINDCMILEDYYNSDLLSLSLALETLGNLPRKNRTIIISDLYQTGLSGLELYSRVADMAKRSGVTRFICLGPEISACREMFPDNTRFYNSTGDFIGAFNPVTFNNEAILLKGARDFRLEKAGRLLERKIHETKLEVDLNALIHNVSVFRSLIPSGTKVMAMVKAFAYGTGANEIAEWLNYNGIDYLAVAYADEGISLRQNGVRNRIMVMSPDPGSFRLMIHYDLEPELYNLDILRDFISESDRHGVTGFPIHIKIDTGMHRLGFLRDESSEMIKLLCSSSAIRIASVFTHLASSEDPENDELTAKQVSLFNVIADEIEKGYGRSFLRHVLNSAGIKRFPEYSFNMVRLGIGLYGIPSSLDPQLKTAVSFKTRIISVRKVKAGQGVGYGFAGKDNKDRLIATVPVGYADGFSRRLGNGIGRMFVKGAEAPVVGEVCMDMCMIDVTSLDVNIGDPVEIFGNNIGIEEVADKCSTIPYEVLTGIPPRVNRVYFYE